MLAFAISQEDVITVLESYNCSANFISENIDDIMNIIDDHRISDAALSYDFSDEDDEEILQKQIEIAYDEIAGQLFHQKYLSKEQIEKYGNKSIILNY